MPIQQAQIRNRLLAGLDPEAFALIQPHLVWRSLGHGASIERPGDPITDVCFPGPGVISVAASISSGDRLEVGMIGPEGMTGLALLHGTDRSPHESLVQIPCRALSLPSDVFERVLEMSRPMHTRLLHFAQAFTVQVAHTALCNGRLSINERLARWLLMCQDRTDREDLPLTHGVLSLMLGVRRPGITIALQTLERAGAINQRRGIVDIRQRALLIELAGNGYGASEAEYDRLLGHHPEIAPERSIGAAPNLSTLT